MKAGDTLLVIEDAEFRLRLAQARADLANASAGRAAAAVSVATMQNNLSVSDAAIEEVRVRMENCAKELARYEQSHRLEQNEAVLRLAEAAVELAELNLSYTVILAPCDGVAGSKDIHEGQLVQPGQTMLEIVDGGGLWVIANYRETQLRHITEGAQVSIKQIYGWVLYACILLLLLFLLYDAPIRRQFKAMPRWQTLRRNIARSWRL